MDPKLVELMGNYLDTCKEGDIFGALDFIEYVKKIMPKRVPARSQVWRLCAASGRCKHAEWNGYYEVIS